MQETDKTRLRSLEPTSTAVNELLRLTEKQLQELVIEPLLAALGFENIKDSSGPRERGKDLVATRENEVGRVELYSIQIKIWKPRGKSAASDSFGFLLNQLAQAIQEPVINPNTHVRQKPNKCLFFTPYPVSMRAEEDYHNRLLEVISLGVEIIDGPQIIRLLTKHAPTTFEAFSTDVQYRLRLLREITRIPESRAAFEGNDLDLARIYVAVSLAEDPLIESIVGATDARCPVDVSPEDVRRIRAAIAAFDSDRVFKETPAFVPPTYHFPADKKVEVDLRLELRPIDAILSQYAKKRRSLIAKESTATECTAIAIQSVYLRKQLEALKKTELLSKSWARLSSHGGKQEALSLSLSTLLRIESPVLILGGPGAGKTTAMRWLARMAAETPDTPLPVLIPLAGLKGTTSGVILQRCAEQLQELSHDHSDFKSRVSSLERLLKKGQVRLLLDGLDETGSSAAPFLRTFDQICTRYPSVPVVVSCRDTLQLRGWDRAFTVHLRAFSDDRIRDFISNWFPVKTKAAELITWLWANPSMREAARTPLIAALLCSLFAVQADMPTTEVDLYDRRFELLLGRWEQAKGLPSLGPKLRRVFLKFLQTLAFYLHCHERRTATPSEVLSIARLSNRLGLIKDSAEMVEDCVRRGVLERQHDGQLTLGHLTYQEFLTAGYLINRKDTYFIWRRLPEPWWQKTLQFYAARTEDITSLLAEGFGKKDGDSMRAIESLMKFAPFTSKRILGRLRDIPARARLPLSEKDIPEIVDLE